MTELRQLAAVLFADIAGYTALMQKDEDAALQILQHFKEELFTTVKNNEGKIIQYFGDGCLMVFNNAANAVASAKVIQENLKTEPKVPVRIGIHLGDVVFREGNIFGDCVNIASRIESMGVPGAVLFSDAVSKQIRNKPEFQLSSLGSFEFKNVEEPMEIFALSNSGFPIPDPQYLNGKFKDGGPTKSVAVMPFDNLSKDPEQEYFSDGMAEEILNSLSHIKDLKVAGRISSFQFKNKNISLKEVGEKLSVKTVLAGSIRKQGTRVRITVQLLNTRDGFQLWSEKYDRELDDIFSVQEEIALAVTDALKVSLLKKDRDLITKSYTPQPDAYEQYLKGRFNVIRRGSYILLALQHFQKAIELDPDFAQAYASFADANLLLATYGLAQPKNVMLRSKQAAEKALLLDPKVAEAYCSLGYYYACYEWNWEEAKKNFLKSLELNPRYIEVHLRYGCNYLTWVEGNITEGEIHGMQAIKAEPLYAICYGTHSLILQTAGKYKEALEFCKEGIEIDPNSFLCRLNEGTLYMLLHQYEESITSYETALKISNRHHFAVNGLLWTHCILGNYDKANELMKELTTRAEKEYIAKTFTGISAAYLNDLDTAFIFLAQAYEDRDPVLLALKYEKWIPENLRKDPRFEKLLSGIGFP